jgi:hypothetical protein
MFAQLHVRMAGPFAALLLAACASSPPPPAAPESPPAATSAAAATPAAGEKQAPPGQRRYKWTRATEADIAAQLDKKFEEAAKAYVQLKRDDQVMFCKKYKEIGSTIRTLHCITEAELRRQVEDSDQVREQMRHKMGKCDIHSGCSAGG